MKPLYEITHESKETKFDLFVYDILQEIENLSNKWFEEVFINHKEYIPTEILDYNIIQDLDYLLTEAIWLIELGESLSYKMDSKQFVESTYNSYTTDGFKTLVTDPRFDIRNNKVFSPDEITQNKKRMNETMKRIISEIDFDN